MALPDKPLLGTLGANPLWTRNWLLFGQTLQPINGAVLCARVTAARDKLAYCQKRSILVAFIRI